MTWPVCCSRALAAPANAKAIAATSAPAGCQPRSRKLGMRPAAAGVRGGEVSPSKAGKPGRGATNASSRCSGEKISDCGSEICGQPAKTLGVQNGDSPRASDAARKLTCGKNCDLAYNGMVTAPDRHGQKWINEESTDRGRGG